MLGVLWPRQSVLSHYKKEKNATWRWCEPTCLFLMGIYTVWISLECTNELISSLTFGQVTDRQTESDAYEPTVHGHRWAQKLFAPPRALTFLALYRMMTLCRIGSGLVASRPNHEQEFLFYGSVQWSILIMNVAYVFYCLQNSLSFISFTTVTVIHQNTRDIIISIRNTIRYHYSVLLRQFSTLLVPCPCLRVLAREVQPLSPGLN